MRKVISISIDNELEEKLRKNVKKTNSSRSEVVKKALRQYLCLEERKRIRKSLRKYAEKAGYFSDEEIYSDFS